MRARASGILVVLLLGGLAAAVVAGASDGPGSYEATDSPAGVVDPPLDAAAPHLAAAPAWGREVGTPQATQRDLDERDGGSLVSGPVPAGAEYTVEVAGEGEARDVVAEPRTAGTGRPADADDGTNPLRPRDYDVGSLLRRAPDARSLSDARYRWGWFRLARLERLLADIDAATASDATRRPTGHPVWLVTAEAPLLRLTPRAADEVPAFEQALDGAARVGGDAISVRVEVYADVGEVAAAFGIAAPRENEAVETPDGAPGTRLPAAVGSLDLDAPADHRVRVFQGTSFAYLQDYDIEVSNAICAWDAIVEAEHVGLAATGLLSGGPQGTPRVHLEVHWSDGTPRFLPFAVNDWPSAYLETPDLARSTFAGSVPARPNSRWLLGLTRGAGALVTLGDVVAGPASIPVWRRVRLGEVVSPGLGPLDLDDLNPLHVALALPPAGRADVQGWVFSCQAGPDGLGFELPGPAFEPNDLSVESDARPALARETLFDVGGGVRLAVCAQPDEGGARAFDVALDVGAVVPQAERVVMATCVGGSYRLRLPAARHTAVAFRVRLAPGETVVREFVVDATGRPERCTLRLSRP